jgi:NAD(P)-dependent dehydrogenase (short-subunit alcohol dehydrogenase family)
MGRDASTVQGKTVIVTGAGSGLGLETADALAHKGASLVLIEYEPSRGETAVSRIAKSGIRPRLFLADLSQQASVRRVAGEILASTPTIDVLINNAGAMFGTRQVTVDGLERTFALNHMAYFLLTNLLLERMTACAPARIVSVSSSAQQPLDFNDLQTERSYSGFRAYARTKLANILFTRALAKRLQGTGITANCLNPGPVRTRFSEHFTGRARVITSIMRPLMLMPAEGARTSIYLASSPEVECITGKYFAKCKISKLSKDAQDDLAAERLWVESLRLRALRDC